MTTALHRTVINSAGQTPRILNNSPFDDANNRKKSDTLEFGGCLSSQAKLEEASTHKSAKTHAGNVFVTRDLDL